jgi:peptide/nickel transport system substrate-binding protein
MDPALAYDALSFQLLYLTCAKLLNFPDTGGPASAQIIPEVAQALPTRSADGRTYTFTIRPGFEFSPPSNQPVTALTFKTTIERTLNPRMHSPIASQFQDIVGADAYTSGHAQHISGITALGDTLTIHLTAPAPDLLARLTEPAFCAVPSDTPIVPSGVAVIPSAGPYRVSAYSPGQGIVLTRNPNYRGSRPRHFARIEVTVGVPLQRAVAQVEAGNADYTGGVPTNDAASLVMRFGPRSPAARSGHQQYFVNPLPQLDALAFNTHRPLFAHLRLRQAVNYAISRTALAQLGDEYVPLPAQVTDHYLPPGIPGHTDVHIYPALPDLARARTLVGHLAGSVATLYTCDISPCDQQAQIIKTDLAAVGIQVAVRTYPDQILYRRIANPGEPFDFAWIGWVADYPDPDAILNELLESGSVIPTFNDPAYRGPLASAAELTGPNRYLTYARLDAQLARNAAPMAAIDNISSIDFFARRIGCQAFGQYGMDLAALCLKPG